LRGGRQLRATLIFKPTGMIKQEVWGETKNARRWLAGEKKNRREGSVEPLLGGGTL